MKEMTRWTIPALAALLAIGLGACAGDEGSGTTTGNPRVDLEFAPYGADGGSLFSWLIPNAYASHSEVKLCFKRLRFKQEGETTSDAATDADNQDFTPGDGGQVTLDPTGTALAAIELPKGIYKRVEFDLEDECGSGLSVQVTNGATIYATDDRITIKFEGTFEAATNGQVVKLGVSTILNALDGVTDGTQIKDAVEAISGTMEEE